MKIILPSIGYNPSNYMYKHRWSGRLIGKISFIKFYSYEKKFEKKIFKSIPRATTSNRNSFNRTTRRISIADKRGVDSLRKRVRKFKVTKEIN